MSRHKKLTPQLKTRVIRYVKTHGETSSSNKIAKRYNLKVMQVVALKAWNTKLSS